MTNHKIVFAGPVGAGKSTAIATISDIEPFTTEEIPTTDEKLGKATTTVALDYGLLKLPNGERVHLYGTPGQDRFDFMWDIVTAGAIGLVLLIDNSRPDPVADMRFYLSAFDELIAKTAVAIGITRTDLQPRPNVAAYQQELASAQRPVPVFEVDARSHDDVVALIQGLLFSLDPDIETGSAPAA